MCPNPCSAASKDITSTSRLFDALLRGGLDELVLTAEGLLENPVFIRDSSHRILAISQNSYNDPFFTALQTTGYFEADVIKGLKKRRRMYAEDCFSGRPVLINFDQDKPDLLTMPVFVNGTIICFVSVAQLNRNFQSEDYDKLILISKAVSIEIQKGDFHTQSIGLLHESILIDLLDRELISDRSKQILDNRLDLLDIHLKPNLFLIATQLPDKLSLPKKRSLAKEVHSLLNGVITCVYHNCIVALITREKDAPFTQEQESSFLQFLEDCSLVAAVSSSYSIVGRTHVRYNNLMEVLDLGQRLKPGRRLHHAHDIFIYQLLQGCSKDMLLMEYIPPKMLRLRDYDRDNNAQMFPTLYYYLIYQKNANAVAAKMNIHRNTLFYRLARINEIASLDLNNEEEVFQLLLAFKILEYSAAESGRPLCFKLDPND